ncbi:VirB3 family type IV secretion system protein [Rhizobium sp. TRM95111]|uniref:VirB3 family type IV secretion system protein n=1 Tax=Rhizobium alarense TaxID=2846851 RepID=UPI001F3CA326|nr:VirB3 family type IV secretion system protein [Rhizobium alarense]MCF3642944.1 VirB3 family type IV secretion system protein [Rhizobium alarense]
MAVSLESSSRSVGYQGDPLFKGCTRPAMIFGVPVVPFVVVGGTVVLIVVWTTILMIVVLPLVVMMMRAVTKSDDQQFRLLGLKMMFRLVNYNRNGRFWKASAYSPIAFKKRK